MPDIIGQPNVEIWDRDGVESGRTTGQTRPCPARHCPGTQLEIEWPDHEKTWVCALDLVWQQGRWQIKPASKRTT